MFQHKACLWVANVRKIPSDSRMLEKLLLKTITESTLWNSIHKTKSKTIFSVTGTPGAFWPKVLHPNLFRRGRGSLKLVTQNFVSTILNPKFVTQNVWPGMCWPTIFWQCPKVNILFPLIQGFCEIFHDSSVLYYKYLRFQAWDISGFIFALWKTRKGEKKLTFHHLRPSPFFKLFSDTFFVLIFGAAGWANAFPYKKYCFPNLYNL